MICNRTVVNCPGYYTKSYNGKGKLSSTIEQRVLAIVSSSSNTDTDKTTESHLHKLHSEYMCKNCFGRLNSIEKHLVSINEFKRKYFETKGHHAARTKQNICSPSVSVAKRCDTSKSVGPSRKRKLTIVRQEVEEKVRAIIFFGIEGDDIYQNVSWLYFCDFWPKTFPY